MGEIAIVPADHEAPTDDLGPALASLSPKHRLFVFAYYEVGGDATKAAEAAGYSATSRGSLQVTAHRIMARNDIKAALQEEARRRVSTLLPKALKAVEQIVEVAEPKDRLKAAAMIMDRAGVAAAVERNVNVTVTITKEEKIAEIRQMGEFLGLPKEVVEAQLLGNVTDVEFEEVPAEQEEQW